MTTAQELPGSVLAAFLQGNTLLPQHDLGINVLAAKAMIDSYLDPEIDGVALWSNTNLVSTTHVDKAMATMRVLHQRYGISCGPDSAVKRMRVLGLIIRSAGTAQDIASGFAWNQLPQLYDRTSYYTYGNTAKLLFARDGSGKLIHADGLALQGMMRVTKEAMFSTEGQTSMRAYRDTALEIMNRNDEQFNIARTIVQNALSEIIYTRVQAALPEIEAETGVSISESALDSYMHMSDLV
jgi:hypothetical protein